MKKLFLFAIFCLAFYQAAAGHSSKNCYVSIYTPEPPIECETVIINGQPEETCSQVGPAEALVILDSKTRSFSIDTEIAEFDYDGNCRCTFKFWSKPHFKGLIRTYTSTKKTNDIVISDIWSHRAKSFKVSCRF